MAKKKKTTTVKVTESNPIKYSGQVIIKKIKNGKVISTTINHNEGTSYLFNFLLNCLAGNLVENLRPCWVYAVQNKNNVLSYVSGIPSYIAGVTVQGSGDDLYVEYKFYLNFQTVYKTRGFNSLVLYSNQDKPTSSTDGDTIYEKYSMVVNFEDTYTADSDTDTLIIWQLKIKN